jgi:membrane protein DedA with SNARE-associated domain
LLFHPGLFTTYHLHLLLEALQHHRLYGYLALFLGTILEGEFVLLAASILAYTHALNIWWVLVIAIAGAVVGDNLWFFVGRTGGRKFVDKYGKFFFLTKKRVDKAELYFGKHGRKTIFFSRFIFGTRMGSAALAGTFGMSCKRFMLSNIMSAVSWVLVTAFIGYFFGSSFHDLVNIFHRTELALLILAGSALIIVIIRFIVTQQDP